MDARIERFIENGCREDDAAAAGVYPRSIARLSDGVVFMADLGTEDVLVAVAVVGFSGEKMVVGGKPCIVAQLDHESAVALRRMFPFTAPSPVLREKRTIGLGDRLGLATDGHIRALAPYDAVPVFAQQSIRELTLTQRTFDDVLDSATFAVFRCGFHRPFGADGDHLKTADEVQMAIDSGYTMITLDCSEHIHGEVGELSEEEVERRYGAHPELEKRYLGKSFLVEDYEIRFEAAELRRIALIYGETIEFAASVYHRFAEGTPLDFELSIDETATPTTPAQHFFVASELKRLGVRPATVAPRFCGEFQKGIDYIGDVEQYAAEFAVHAAIARRFGYKISIHSGSDKFSVFPVSGRLSHGTFHVKTAGTNWLEAMEVVAEHEPALYREIHQFALAHFEEATRYYHVTTRLDRIPDLAEISDQELPRLFQLPDVRQLIHITYGLILTDRRSSGDFTFRDRLYKFWRQHREEYADHLERHIGRHLELLYSEIEMG